MKTTTRLVVLAMGLAGLWGCGGGGGGGTHSSLVVMDPNGNAVTFAAFQNGSGAWVPLTANGSGQYSATVSDPAGRYGIAAYNNVSKVLWIWQATTSELNHLTLLSPAPSPGAMVVTGTTSGLVGFDEDLNIWATFSNHQDVTGNGTYFLSAYSVQPWDAVGIFSTSQTPVSMAVRRNLDTSATTQNFDVTSSDFQPVTTYQVAVTPAQSSTARLAGVQLNTANGTVANLGSGYNNFSFVAPAVSQRGDGDFYETSNVVSNNANSYSEEDVFRIDPVNQTIGTPSYTSDVSVSMTAGSNPLFHATWTPDSSAKIFSFELTTADDQSRYQVYTTRGWLGGSASKSYMTPDLSQVTGWTSNLALSSSLMNWTYQGTATQMSTADYFDPNAGILDGTLFTSWTQGDLNLSGAVPGAKTQQRSTPLYLQRRHLRRLP